MKCNRLKNHVSYLFIYFSKVFDLHLIPSAFNQKCYGFASLTTTKFREGECMAKFHAPIFLQCEEFLHNRRNHDSR